MRPFIVAMGCLIPSLAFPCEGKRDCPCPVKAHAAASSQDPAACAKKAVLIGSNCSYSTGVMAQRVLAEGDAYTYTGTMEASDNALASHVASPYTVGPDHAIHVVANEVLEALTNEGAATHRVELEGKVLQVDDIKYLVVTSYAATQDT